MNAVAEPQEKPKINADELAMALTENTPIVDLPLRHLFAPGVYIREIFMPAGTVVVGHRHKTKHFNIVLKGKCAVTQDGIEVMQIEAPMTFVSDAGVQKILLIKEDTTWQTVHPVNEKEVEAMAEEEREDMFVEKSELALEVEKLVKAKKLEGKE